ncbi:hypothetical protein F442_01830 [Phytophthora nicotianae P10297]|uniref:Uncharacterized protein n=5 Tax=Phytophthora nicotianae TaxID=4792 RepID=W2QU71_PHYN3|nr:hypothetical protein PPTG_21994 [Phytophthora nicotianae INRA-310]ETI55423.1 hypothetical protein F443_01891 [Phytophthora nicotianae P1569]ETK95233.1 hypothetical protein L915_01818 [Phytophthora nicotianae]ETO84164.1 hypothetical protein F444_01896 [Phytophthora nicotianae P1976]ETP53245.1 hypothetical protein F442_01830 [Phytophthora nicotianae P10297]ETL48632.1 hypothetical protein L916_01781 [Phytophthora nicotianae]
MAPGSVDVLAVVDKDKVAIQGTCYMRKMIREKCGNQYSLERFNQELNDTFVPHPSVPVFAAGIEALARHHVQALQGIPSNRAKSPHRREKYTWPKKVAFPN